VRTALPSLLACLLALESGCDSRPAAERSGAGPPARLDSEARSDSPERVRVVVLQAGPLHLGPDPHSPAVTQVPAGALLDVVPDPAGGDAWVRVATWDDRHGWLPASRIMEPEQWAQYGRALGGVSPVLVRPAYPVEGGRWAVEAPLGSGGLTTASTAWLLADSALGARVVGIDSVDNLCGGERYRFAVLDRPFGTQEWPRLEEGLLATPSGGRPAARRLAVRPFEPDAELTGLANRLALEGSPPGGRTPPASIEWTALGEAAAWAALSWPAEDPASGQAQRGLAIVFRRTANGWERLGTVGPAGSSASIPTPAWRPVAAYATGASTFPTMLLLEEFEYEGAHLDVWIHRGERYERTYRGYYWGC
jgi:hypothetical protein